MTKEWQEATNEYLKVRFDSFSLFLPHMVRLMSDQPLFYRERGPTPSMVSVVKDTAAKVRYRASQRRSNEHKLGQWWTSIGVDEEEKDCVGKFNGAKVCARCICFKHRSVPKLQLLLSNFFSQKAIVVLSPYTL